MYFETIQSDVIYQGRIFDVRRDRVLLPDSQQTTLDIVAHAGAVVIVPLDGDTIWFVRQYRHAAGKELIELPAGGLEENEAVEACAYRELQEEIGMSAGELIKLGEFFLAPGYSTELLHIFLARDLSPAALPRDEDEFLVVGQTSIQDFYTMAANGEIQDAKSLAALLLLQKHPSFSH